jgi:hypothetical protein
MHADSYGWDRTYPFDYPRLRLGMTNLAGGFLLGGAGFRGCLGVASILGSGDVGFVGFSFAMLRILPQTGNYFPAREGIRGQVSGQVNASCTSYHVFSRFRSWLQTWAIDE